MPLAFKPPLDEFGVLFAGAFEKKLAIDRCFDCEPPALEFCFFKEGEGLAGVAAMFSLPGAIVTDGRVVQ